MIPKVQKKNVIFTGHEHGAPQQYLLKTQTEAQAQELKAALDREVALVKAKAKD